MLTIFERAEIYAAIKLGNLLEKNNSNLNSQTLNMSQNQNISYTCDCKRATCRHQFAEVANENWANANTQFLESPSSPSPEPLPNLSESDINEALIQAHHEGEPVVILTEDEREEILSQSLMTETEHGDSQPMFLDEDANDGFVSDPERFDQNYLARIM